MESGCEDAYGDGLLVLFGLMGRGVFLFYCILHLAFIRDELWGVSGMVWSVDSLG